MGDAVITGIIAVLTVGMAYMGVHVTLYPPEKRNIRYWAAGFIVVGCLVAILTVWQAQRSAKAQKNLQGELDNLPKKFPKPPTAEENAEAVLALQQKRQQPIKAPQRKQSKTLEKEPLPSVNPVPQVAKFSISQSDEVSSKTDMPYRIQVVVQTNTEFSHLRLAIQCDGPIADVRPGNSGIFIGGSGIVKGHPDVYVMNYRSVMPPFGPANPIIVNMWSVNRITCDKAAEF